jgi:hypothetical protein
VEECIPYSGSETVVREMKREIVTILLILMAVSFTGCTGQDGPESGPALQQLITPGSMSHEITTVTTDRQPVTPVQITAPEDPVKIFNGGYRWVEYRENNTVTMPPNPRSSWLYNIRLERSTGNYNGNPAIHFRITTISDYSECCIDNIVTKIKDGRVSVEDSYYDASTDKLLGETYSETIKSVLQPPEDYTAYYSQHNREDGPAGEMGITPFDDMNITLTDLGTESVTVLAGTYPDARKYSGKFQDGTQITFWVTPGVPVPVQYQFPNKHLDGVDPVQSYELKGWG